MIKHQTVGQLVAALAEYPADTPLTVLYEARCAGSDGIAVVGMRNGVVVLDADGDESRLRSGHGL